MAQDVKENLVLALDTLRAHKLRSFLTILGVIIGVSVLMLVGALIAGFNQSVVDNITSFGGDSAYVSRLNSGPTVTRPTKEQLERKPLTVEDAEAIALNPHVKAVTAWIGQWQVSHNVFYQANEVDGKIKEVTGKVVGDKKLEVKGNVQGSVGAAQTKLGEVKRDAKDSSDKGA